MNSRPNPGPFPQERETQSHLAHADSTSSSPLPPASRADGFLRWLENGWLYLDRLIQSAIPTELNPLGQLGAIANSSLIIAVLSGIALLIWYTPSVHHAYESLETIRQTSWMGQLVRSIHRYSSDGCLCFVLLHALRIVCQRRFTGPRRLAWITGLLLLALLWFIGWTGYWLVWDVRGQHAALGTVRFIDRLPLFAEPLSRAFLTDQSVPSLLFFLIFFVHMLAPLAMGVGIWMHLMRMNRAKILAGPVMVLWIVGSLVALSLVKPAFSASPALMTVKTLKFNIDGWYLWPFVLTDRLSGGLLWSVFLVTGTVVLTVPWWMAKRRIEPQWKAQVDLPRCMGCTLCAQDCPFNAITMVAREDGRKFIVQSAVNPDLCVSCGICTGSCDTQAINMPGLNSREVEKRLHVWIDAQKARGLEPFVAFCCAESSSAVFRADSDGNSAELPGYSVQTIPCVGWVSAVILERTLQRGAGGVLVVGCGEGDPVAREGMKWFEQRMLGRREPRFDPAKADPTRVRFVQFDRTRRAELLTVAREFQQKSTAPPDKRPRQRVQSIAAAIVLVASLSAVIFSVGTLPYRTPHSSQPELVVSFNHSGAIVNARKLTPEERAKRLPHMRAQVNVARERTPVRLRVQVDGQTVFDDSFQPKGLSKDGPSIAVTRLPIAAGQHSVHVELADTIDANAWTKQWSEKVSFESNRTRVILFDTKAGFTLH